MNSNWQTHLCIRLSATVNACLSHLEEHSSQLMRACVELAKAWRTDKYLRRLEAVLLVADKDQTFELTGMGDVLDPQYNCMGIGRWVRRLGLTLSETIMLLHVFTWWY